MAVASHDLVISLFSENCEQQDKFATKPCDSNAPRNSYTITGLAFSNDGVKLAIAQSDNIIFVYKIGENWGDKKSIVNKFIQQTFVTCLIWPKDQEIIFGTADGKVRIANTHTNKSSSLYNSESHTISLSSVGPNTIISGHVDCKVIRCHLQKSQDNIGDQGCIFKHSCTPYVLINTAHQGIIVAGGDKRIVVYSNEGNLTQQFDYSKQDDEYAFTVGKLSNSGNSFVIGSFDKIRLFTWDSRKGTWNPQVTKEIKNLYTITAIDWKPDDSKMIFGTLCGGVEIIDCCLKRLNFDNKINVTYVGSNQILVQPKGNVQVGDSSDSVVIKSNYDYDIENVKLCPGERYLVVHTTETIIVMDLLKKIKIEVVWSVSQDEEYITHDEHVFMVYTLGELIVLEFGGELLGSVRTQFLSPKLMSVRINERRQKIKGESCKMLSYMIDKCSFAIIDFNTNNIIAQYDHKHKIKWLEMNETCRYLIFLDKHLHLYLFKISNQEKNTRKSSVSTLNSQNKVQGSRIHLLLNYCTWVNWIDASDVILAETKDSLCVWYIADNPEHFVSIPKRGDIVEVVRGDDDSFSVKTSYGPTQHDVNSYKLDEGMIEFGTAIEDDDLERAVKFLEKRWEKSAKKASTSVDESNEDWSHLWKKLSISALKKKNLWIVWRCFTALGDWSRADFIFETICYSLQKYQKLNFDDYHIQARLALFQQNIKEAEKIYLKNNNVDKAIDMYLKIDKWDEAVEIAKFKSHPRLKELEENHYKWLLSNDQQGKVAVLKVKSGDYIEALNLFLKANRPSQAASILIDHPNVISTDATVFDKVCSSLVKLENFNRVGELLEKFERNAEALKCYKKGHVYRRAVELARKIEPENVTKLEEKWGDQLFNEKQYDEAINHFIESGNTTKAVDCCIKARQWNKAFSIVEGTGEFKKLEKQCTCLAEYYETVGNFINAEKLYIETGNATKAVTMFKNNGMWTEAHRLAISFMERSELIDMYLKEAVKLEAQEKLKEAENLYIEIEEPSKAIIMYKKKNMHSDMLRLVKKHYPDKYVDTQRHLAKELEKNDRLVEAEKMLLDSDDWANVIRMYKNRNKWEDAYKVAKSHAPKTAQDKVAYAWAMSIGPSLARKTLDHYECLEGAIDQACQNHDFEMAYSLIGESDEEKEQLKQVQYKQALFYETEKNFEEAEKRFIESQHAKEAVLMYLQAKNWLCARRVAEKHVPEVLTDVLVGEAKLMFVQKDYTQGEALFLRAKRPEMCIEMYIEQDMWDDALRICKDYLPNQMAQLERKYEKYVVSSGKKSRAEDIIKQAKDYESSGLYTEAVSCYLRLTKEHTNNVKSLVDAWNRAKYLAQTFLTASESCRVAEMVAVKLVEISNHLLASDIYLALGQNKKAVSVLVEGKHWDNALKLSGNLDPKLHALIEKKYKESLINCGKVDQLVEVDPEAALKVYAQTGEWDKCFQLAKKINSSTLGKYITMCATLLMRNDKNDPTTTLMVFSKYGVIFNTSNIELYKSLYQLVIQVVEVKNYKTWSTLRNVYYQLYTSTDWSQESDANLSSTNILNIGKIFEPFFWQSHYGAIRATCMDQLQGIQLASKLSLSMLRFGHMPIDKAFYEAGSICKAAGLENVAYVILNHFVDISEAIDDTSNSNFLDTSEFKNKTDFVCDVKLPTTCFCSESTVEAIREWLLATSISNDFEQTLKVNSEGRFESSLSQNAKISSACIISGYPIGQSAIKFENNSHMSIKEEWNKYVMNAKVSKNLDCRDVLKFIQKWNGAPTTPSSLTLI